MFSTPKTNAGRRTIHLDDGTVNVLRTPLRTEQAMERLAFGAGYREHGLVFCFEDGKPYHPDRVSRAFKERIESLRLPHIRLHDTRHTWATLALVAGVPVKVVQERLGHSTPAITMAVYQHASPGVDRQAADTVAARRGRLRLPPVYRLRCGTTFDSPAAPITPATKSAA